MKPGAGLKRHFIPTMAGLEVQEHRMKRQMFLTYLK